MIKVESIPELRKICQAKLYSYERSMLNPIPWCARNIHLRISIYITWALLHTRISANQVTCIFLGIGLLACYLFCLGQPWMYLVGAILLQLRYTLDSVDGEIARYRKTSSATGEYLDFIEHYVIGGLVFFALGIGLHKQFGGTATLYAGFLSSFCYILVNILYDGKGKYLLLNIMRRVGELKVGGAIIGGKERERLISGSSPKNQMLRYKLIKSFSLYPGINNVLLITAILDLVVLAWFPERHGVNLFYVLLCSYAIFYPLSFVKNLTVMVRQRTLDSELDDSLERIRRLLMGDK